MLDYVHERLLSRSTGAKHPGRSVFLDELLRCARAIHAKKTPRSYFHVEELPCFGLSPKPCHIMRDKRTSRTIARFPRQAGHASSGVRAPQRSLQCIAETPCYEGQIARLIPSRSVLLSVLLRNGCSEASTIFEYPRLP